MSIKKFFSKQKRRIFRVCDRFFWYKKIGKKIKKIISDSDEFWEQDYIKSALHHSHQNKLVANDFIKNIYNRPLFISTIKGSNKILDFGCGTGEFSFFLSKSEMAKNSVFIGAEISSSAIQIANNLYKNDNLNFIIIDKSCDLVDVFGSVDLVICSQVLEHFKYPNKIIDKLLEISRHIIILVPYKQGKTDDYIEDGGPGHVSTFDKDSFSSYKVLDQFVFKTIGWDFSSSGEEPLQLAVLLEKI